ncbi:hypothetical protein A2U01_0111921, partial [Trifolium medium]|nr:hypothetical protein [Trifolium medium]
EPEYEEGFGDPDTRRHVDALVEKIAEEFNDAEGLGVQEKTPVSPKGGVVQDSPSIRSPGGVSRLSVEKGG